MNICNDCNKVIEYSKYGMGYAIVDNKKICYDCMAERDQKEMIQNGKMVLYLTKEYESMQSKNFKFVVTNWPGTLRFDTLFKYGKHNITGKRIDAWFKFNGHVWHGVNYGTDNLIYCKQTKQTKWY